MFFIVLIVLALPAVRRDLSSNQLNGTLPDALCSGLANLTYLCDKLIDQLSLLFFLRNGPLALETHPPCTPHSKHYIPCWAVHRGLSSNQLGGTLPDALGGLGYLTHLCVRFDQFAKLFIQSAESLVP